MLLLLFVVTPIIEISLFIVIGDHIGVLATIGLIIVTAVIGFNMLRQQSLDTMMAARQTARQGQLPAFAMIESVLLLVGGLMLLTPGFLTDTLGFLCLFRATRGWIIHTMVQRFFINQHGFTFRSWSVRHNHHHQRRPRRSRYIEGEYRKEEDDER